MQTRKKSSLMKSWEYIFLLGICRAVVGTVEGGDDSYDAASELAARLPRPRVETKGGLFFHGAEELVKRATFEANEIVRREAFESQLRKDLGGVMLADSGQ